MDHILLAEVRHNGHVGGCVIDGGHTTLLSTSGHHSWRHDRCGCSRDDRNATSPCVHEVLADRVPRDALGPALDAVRRDVRCSNAEQSNVTAFLQLFMVMVHRCVVQGTDSTLATVVLLVTLNGPTVTAAVSPLVTIAAGTAPVFFGALATLALVNLAFTSMRSRRGTLRRDVFLSAISTAMDSTSDHGQDLFVVVVIIVTAPRELVHVHLLRGPHRRLGVNDGDHLLLVGFSARLSRGSETMLAASVLPYPPSHTRLAEA